MSVYDSARKFVQAQIDSISAQRALADPTFDSASDAAKDELTDALLRDSLGMAIAILVRLDVMDDAKNDQCQASARELTKLLANRLDIDLSTRLGVDL